MAKRWWFKEDAEHQRVRWSWQLFRDDIVDRQSAEFDNYGAAVVDAIAHGFCPSVDRWVLETARLISHYAPGKPAVVQKKKSGKASVSPSPTGKLRPIQRASEKRRVRGKVKKRLEQ